MVTNYNSVTYQVGGKSVISIGTASFSWFTNFLANDALPSSVEVVLSKVSLGAEAIEESLANVPPGQKIIFLSLVIHQLDGMLSEGKRMQMKHQLKKCTIIVEKLILF